MNKVYQVYWSRTAIDALEQILAYPMDVKERIYLDTFERLAHMPVLTAKQIQEGALTGYWVRLGLY